jgi:hypothetical protein
MTLLTVAVTLVAFAVGLAIGVSPTLVRSHLSPSPPVKVHYCYPDSVDAVCALGRAGLLPPVPSARPGE